MTHVDACCGGALSVDGVQLFARPQRICGDDWRSKHSAHTTESAGIAQEVRADDLCGLMAQLYSVSLSSSPSS